MRAITSTLCFAMLVLAGCSGLILRDNDTAGEKTGKVAARVLLCPLTVCFSEGVIASARRDEERHFQEALYRRWLQSLSPEDRAHEYALEQARIQAAGQALMGLGFGGPFHTAPIQPPTPSTQYRSTPKTCTYNAIGQTLYQNCY